MDGEKDGRLGYFSFSFCFGFFSFSFSVHMRIKGHVHSRRIPSHGELVRIWSIRQMHTRDQVWAVDWRAKVDYASPHLDAIERRLFMSGNY